MAKESTIQIRIDTETKKEVEALYNNLGTSFSEAVRIFAKQSIYEKGFPFVARNLTVKKESLRGCLSKYASPKLIEKEKNAFANAMVKKYE